MDHGTKTDPNGMAEFAMASTPNADSPFNDSTSLVVDHSGTTIHLQSWHGMGGDPRPPLVVVHDLGEQSDDYQDFAADMVGHGWPVYAFDLRGHGRSGRRLGHAPSFRSLVKDLLQVAAWVRHKEQGRSPIIIGQGVGALVVMEFTKTHGQFCQAAILSAPCLELATPVSGFQHFLLKIVSDIMPTARYPRFLTPVFANFGGLANRGPGDDLGAAARLSFFPRLTATFAHELLRAVRRAEASFIEYHGSVLILCPDQDTVCVFNQLKRFAALHNEHNLEIVDLKDCGHGVFTSSSASRGKAIEILRPWLTRVLSGAMVVPDAGAPAPAASETRLGGAAVRKGVAVPGEDSPKPGATKF